MDVIMKEQHEVMEGSVSQLCQCQHPGSDITILCRSPKGSPWGNLGKGYRGTVCILFYKCMSLHNHHH